VVVRPKADPADVGSIGAPMPGVVVEVRAQAGTRVAAGDALVVLSAMKMETVVAAPVAGVLERVAVAVGDTLGAGDLIGRIAVASAA
jgi:pyruvate carboxylase